MDILDVQFPLARQNATGLKSTLKIGLGRALLPLRRTRAEQLRTGRLGARLSLPDRLMIAALVEQHEKLGTLDQLNGLHDWLWSSEQAVRFHEQARARFDSWWLQQHSAVIAPLQAMLDAQPGAFHTLIEIGCGSGLVLEDVAKRLPQLQRLIGLDLSAEQSTRNAQQHADQERLQFHSGDAALWLQQHAERGSVCFTNAGVLEYFPEQKLRGMLRQLATLAPSAFVCVEPLAAGHDLARELTSRSYGAERSWSHNYPHLFNDCGFNVLWQRELEFAGVRWLLCVAQARA